MEDSEETPEARLVRTEKELKAAQKRADCVGYACFGGLGLGIYLFTAPLVISTILTAEAWLRARPVLEERAQLQRTADDISILRTKTREQYLNLYKTLNRPPENKSIVLELRFAEIHIHKDFDQMKASLERLAGVYKEAVSMRDANSRVVYFDEVCKETKNLRWKYLDISAAFMGFFASLGFLLPQRFEIGYEKRYYQAREALSRAEAERAEEIKS